MTTPSQTLVNIPSNIYKPNAPLEAEITEHYNLCHEDSPNQVCHIVLNLKGSEMRYMDGQSIGVLPPGIDEKTGKPHKLRLYSIASPHYGDDGNGETVSVCVKRALNPPHPPGVCSSYLCDSKVGDVVKITGPVGKSFLLPPEPDANIIMIATGTGIAPFRAFLKTRFEKRAEEKGQYWLFFGAQTRKDYLYGNELDELLENHGDDFKLVTAWSREQQNKEGGRMYVQHRLEEYAETIFNLLKDKKTYIFMCGLRGMEPGVMEGLQKAAESQGIQWDAFHAELKAENRWHVEVY